MDNGHSHVLLVEDNSSDLRLTKEAFQDLDPLVILERSRMAWRPWPFSGARALTSVPFALR
jgi:hypothetical protein